MVYHEGARRPIIRQQSATRIVKVAKDRRSEDGDIVLRAYSEACTWHVRLQDEAGTFPTALLFP